MAYHRFIADDGTPYGSFQVFYDDADIPEYGTTPRNYDADGEPVKPGWYWWSCFPGCLPDGDPMGPFKTEQDAYNHAMEV